MNSINLQTNGINLVRKFRVYVDGTIYQSHVCRILMILQAHDQRRMEAGGVSKIDGGR